MAGLGNLAKMINNATKQMTPADKFIHDLNQTISRGAKDEQRPSSKSFKPSSLGKCLRLNYFIVTGAPKDDRAPDPELVGMGESGTDRHERIQTWVSKMKKYGYNCEWIDVEEFLKIHPVAGTKVVKKTGMETKCYNEVFDISFLCDGIIKFEGIYYILEIKTEASFKWNGQKEAFDDHKVQATTYSVCLGIDRSLFLYEERDLCRKKAFIVEITNDMKEEFVIARIEVVNNHIAEGTVPPKSIIVSDCSYCEFTKECAKWGD